MKTPLGWVTLLLVVTFAPTASADDGDRTITRVVKMLEEMLKKSKSDGDKERDLFAKFKCYCDQSTEDKTASIETLTTQIEKLSSEIEELQGSSGKLSTECAELKKSMADNEESRSTAEALRQKENEEYLETKKDLEGAITQMRLAIETLAEVGADQTVESAGDHKRFMAGYQPAALLGVKATLHQALTAASAFLTPLQQKSVQSFIQAPFTGNYASQSGEVVGILKNMLDTFEDNLQSATETENAQKEAFDKLMATLTEGYSKMSKEYDGKQGTMGENDDSLADSKSTLETARKQKASDEEFLDKLTPMCALKTKEYDERKMLRTNEETAIAEAIAILNSDAAFETFGKVDATSTGGTGPGFIQLSSRHRRIRVRDHSVRAEAKQLISKARSARLKKLVALLQANNPFDEVLREIKKMEDLIEEEGKVDSDNLKWCNSERTSNDAAQDAANDQVLALSGEIEQLDDDIENEETGLKVMISQTEEKLEENTHSQESQTKDRKEENKVYQMDIKHLVKAEALLQGALDALKTYYASIAEDKKGTGFAQEEPAPPETWDGAYSGQSERGASAISMLEYIMEETKKEESAAHAAEQESQASYEDSMGTLKTEEAAAIKTLGDLQMTLAEKERMLQEKKEEKKKTEAQLAAIAAYLLKIKPGCDFITLNYDMRESHRMVELKALKDATALIKSSPVYKAAVAEAHQESLGKCRSKCKDETHVKCKACLAKVTVVGYCAGHPDTAGCDVEPPAPAE